MKNGNAKAGRTRRVATPAVSLSSVYMPDSVMSVGGQHLKTAKTYKSQFVKEPC